MFCLHSLFPVRCLRFSSNSSSVYQVLSSSSLMIRRVKMTSDLVERCSCRVTSPSVLGIKSYDGVWGLRSRPDVVKGVAARAEAITRTELTRVFNLAQTEYQRQASARCRG